MKASGETAAWRQYEAGRDYKRRIGLYETVRTNERFYRGDQWKGISNLTCRARYSISCAG